VSGPPGEPTLAARRRFLRRSVHGLLLPAVATTAACTIGAGPDHDGRDAPATGITPLRDLPDDALALVLSSGGPRGFVHIGVLHALDDLGVRPDLVVGASVGALLAALYCGGTSGRELSAMARDLNPLAFAALAIGARERFSGAPMARFVNDEIDGRPLQDLRPRCAVVAMRAIDRQCVAFTHGDAGVAVQASAAIESRFTPVTIRGEVYVDSDRVMPLPVRIAQELGSQRVLSVDASAHEDRAPPGAERFRDSDRIKRLTTSRDAGLADVNLHPYFGYWVSLDAEFRERAMRAGYEETMARRQEVLALAAGSRPS
jgi:NTE family protein